MLHKAMHLVHTKHAVQPVNGWLNGCPFNNSQPMAWSLLKLRSIILFHLKALQEAGLAEEKWQPYATLHWPRKGRSDKWDLKPGRQPQCHWAQGCRCRAGGKEERRIMMNPKKWTQLHPLVTQERNLVKWLGAWRAHVEETRSDVWKPMKLNSGKS